MKYLVYVMLAAFILILILFDNAKSHNNPVTGISCCGAVDCSQIKFEDVKIVEGGYYIK